MINILVLFSSQGLPPPATRTMAYLRWPVTLCHGRMKNNSESRTSSAQPGSGLRKILGNCTTNRAIQTLKTSLLSALCPKQNFRVLLTCSVQSKCEKSEVDCYSI